MTSKQRVRVGARARERERQGAADDRAPHAARGTFSAKAPSAGRYSLRVGTRERTITVVARRSRRARSPPVTRPAVARLRAADRRSRRAAAWRDERAAGGTLPLEVVNTSTGCLTLGVGYSFERLQDGAWVAVPSNQVFVTLAVLLAPGQALRQAGDHPGRLPFPAPTASLDSVTGATNIELAAQFEVTG